MSLFHQHQWREMQRVFTGPSGLSSLDRATRDTAERLIWGITTMLYSCDTCGLTRQIEIKGDARIRENAKENGTLAPYRDQP